MAEVKLCKHCGEEKPLTEYSKVLKGKYYNSSCKSCQVLYTKKYHKQNPEKHINSIKEWNNKKQGVYGIFSGDECLYVGESGKLLHRIASHKSRINNLNCDSGQPELYIRIAEYDGVQIKILEETLQHKEREKYWINKLNPKFNGYV